MTTPTPPDQPQSDKAEPGQSEPGRYDQTQVGQPYGATPLPGQALPGQPHPGQPQGGNFAGQAPKPGQQPYPGQQAYPGHRAYPGQQAYPGQHYGSQQPFPGQQPYPGQPYAPAFGAPQPPKKSRTGLIVGLTLGAVALLAIASIALVVLLSSASKSSSSDRAGSTTKPTSTSDIDKVSIGDCVLFSGTGLSADITPVDCSTASAASYIVGDKVTTDAVCTSMKYDASFSEYGGSSGNKTLCLVPNYELNTCYEQSTLGIDHELTTVPCDTVTGQFSLAFQVTERVNSTSVPNCSDPEKHKVQTFTINSSPPSKIGYCLVILGDYMWDE